MSLIAVVPRPRGKLMARCMNVFGMARYWFIVDPHLQGKYECTHSRNVSNGEDTKYIYISKDGNLLCRNTLLVPQCLELMSCGKYVRQQLDRNHDVLTDDIKN